MNKAAGGNGAAGHAGGFAEMPGNLTGTVTHFQDNQAQTNFWAAFLSEANTINAQLTAIQNGQAQASQALVTQITNYDISARPSMPRKVRSSRRGSTTNS